MGKIIKMPSKFMSQFKEASTASVPKGLSAALTKQNYSLDKVFDVISIIRLWSNSINILQTDH